jgi:hypothetical protein
VPGAIWLEADLPDFPILGLTSADALGSFETGPAERNHVGMLGASPVVCRPDAGVIVAVGPAPRKRWGEGRQKNLHLGEFAGVQKIPAVNVDPCERAAMDEGA